MVASGGKVVVDEGTSWGDRNKLYLDNCMGYMGVFTTHWIVHLRFVHFTHENFILKRILNKY